MQHGADLPYAAPLNNSSEREIASLPGVGVIVAKRVISLRDSRGGFHSVEDFGEALNLKPHVVERIRPLVFVSPPQQSGSSGSSGRVVDF
jgi:DNA uptake protein ComE-like DNA-binding protein